MTIDCVFSIVTIDVEVWMIALTAGCAIAPWAFSIHAKVAVIASAVESLPEMVEELRDALDEHEHRLNEHAKDIQALKETASPRG
jgi:ABC-type molybdate transport system permease subunit